MGKIKFFILICFITSITIVGMEKEECTPLENVTESFQEGQDYLLFPEIFDPVIEDSLVWEQKLLEKKEKKEFRKPKLISYLDNEISKFKPAICDQCAKSFKTRIELSKHIKEIHPYACKCGNYFSYEQVLAKHKMYCVYNSKKIVKK